MRDTPQPPERGAELPPGISGGRCPECLPGLGLDRETEGHEDLATAPPRHYRRPVERPFTRQERDRVTLLFGGFSRRHDRLLYAAVQGLGYKAKLIPVPTKTDFQTGKEYGNNGQCNPTYFTVGALINYLGHLHEEEGLPTGKILSDYVFVTAGSCGPCRFGMYEAEYRLALRNAGFEGFRVILFDQTRGIQQSDSEDGLEMNVPFFLMVLNSFLMGDLLNEVAYQIRPYATDAGKAEEAFERGLAICQRALRTHSPEASPDGRLLGRIVAAADRGGVAAFLGQLRGTRLTGALAECRRLFDEQIEVDYTRPRPIVKITGEFWAQITEGDGNFRMFSFLEKEGAEVLVEPVGTWVDYLINDARLCARDRRGLIQGWRLPGFWQRLRLAKSYRLQLLNLALANRILVREYERMRRALGGTAHPLANQLELQRVAHPYYNSRCSGGEGHLEVAKNIYYSNRDLAHMVLSLKPFGCMPSTQSDGVQAAVIAQCPQMIYLPIETSGEGEVNARSRVQMALGEAKAKCKAEFEACVERTGYSLDEICTYVRERRELRRPLLEIPRTRGVVGRAANFILYVASLMDREPQRRASGSRWRAERRGLLDQQGAKR